MSEQELLNSIMNNLEENEPSDDRFVKKDIKPVFKAPLEPKKDVVVKKEMAMENGNFVLENSHEQLRYAQHLINQGLVSDTFKKPEQLVIAIQSCKDLGLPNSCLKDFYVIHGKPAIYGDTFLALMFSTGLLDTYVIEFFDNDGVMITIPKKGQCFFGCQITIKRKGFLKETKIHYTMDDKELSLSTNPTWKKAQRDMLLRRCAGRAAKWVVPDAIRGIEMADYLEDATVNTEIANNVASLANEAFKD